MQSITMLIKPVSGNCNLRCKYCFYEDVTEKRQIKSHGMMNDDTLLKLVKRALSEADKYVTFAFQGGEPTLAGLEFYEKLIEYIAEYNHKNLKINMAIQTNGMVIDEKWSRFFAENNFLVGLSLDGYKEIHNVNRGDRKGNGSFNQVMRAAKLFDKHKVEYNILCVVTSKAAKHIDKIYRFYKNNGFKYLQFIPCLDPLEEERGGYKHSLSPKDYEFFLKTLFDRWYDDFTSNNYISVRHLDNYLQLLMGHSPKSCGTSGRCSCYFVVEADGSVYPCDFYVLDKWCIGNISDNSFEGMSTSEIAEKFVEQSVYVDKKCRLCKWYCICRGGCRRDREPFVDGRPDINYFCESYKQFFEYAADRMIGISKQMLLH